MHSDPVTAVYIILVQNARENPPRVYIQAMTHLSSSTDPHYLLSAGSGSCLCHEHGTLGWSGLSQRGMFSSAVTDMRMRSVNNR